MKEIQKFLKAEEQFAEDAYNEGWFDTQRQGMPDFTTYFKTYKQDAAGKHQ